MSEKQSDCKAKNEKYLLLKRALIQHTMFSQHKKQLQNHQNKKFKYDDTFLGNSSWENNVGFSEDHKA